MTQGSISYYKIHLFHNLFKGEQKDTATTTTLAQAPSIQNKKVDKNVAKKQDSFCTQTSHVAQMDEQIQPRQQQVHDSLPQRNVSSNASRTPRFNRFPLSPRNSTQWIPLLPKEGGLIQVDISGHPPFPSCSK
jgi:hypothetical protein